MKPLETLFQKIDALEPIPPVAHRILAIANSKEGTVSDLVDLLLYDPALTANLLKICNSAYYGFSVHVDSVRHAVNLLGMNEIVQIVLMKTAGEKLMKAQKGYGLKKGELWKHSVASALLAKSFAEKNSAGSDKFLIYTATLLKDIGKVVIEGHVSRSLAKIMSLVEKRGYSFDQAEEKVIGIDHARLGAMIAERWNFSPRMAFLIGNHHLADPAVRCDFEATIVYLADTVSRMASMGIGADGLAYRVYDDIFGDLGVSEADIRDLAVEFQANLRVAERLISSFS